MKRKSETKGVRPLPKRVRERFLREVAKMTPEQREREAEEFGKLFSGFLDVYKDRPMA